MSLIYSKKFIVSLE